MWRCVRGLCKNPNACKARSVSMSMTAFGKRVSPLTSPWLSQLPVPFRDSVELPQTLGEKNSPSFSSLGMSLGFFLHVWSSLISRQDRVWAGLTRPPPSRGPSSLPGKQRPTLPWACEGPPSPIRARHRRWAHTSGVWSLCHNTALCKIK